MIIQEMFKRDINRQIDGVIKTNDTSSLAIEFEEYVLTKEASERLDAFFCDYTAKSIKNSGAWVSGFFGSGKSHLLKILSMVLENRKIGDKSAMDIFRGKVESQFLQGHLDFAAQIPSESILFNIDQKTDTINKKKDADAILSVFVKVFYEKLGFYGVQPHLAKFEQTLDSDGLFTPFKAKFKELASKDWAQGREEVSFNKRQVAEALAAVKGGTPDDYKNILDEYRNDYKLSFETFAAQVKKYIDSKGDKFRLNFFVDEVGQYIADDTKLMLNLQTLAETLVTVCEGRAWVIVTAQEEMDSVIGGLSNKQGNDFSKIQARFATKLQLTSQDVAEVISERLLKKSDDAAQKLGVIYNTYQNDFKTLFGFKDGSRVYKQISEKGDFVKNYPFIPYQFPLFQAAIKSLSDNNAFQGRHSSVGERSMLGVFQAVAKAIAAQSEGKLATFDLMYEGLRSSIKSTIIGSILQAEDNLGDVFATRVLKCLFLVKYVKEFKPSIDNICILMRESLIQSSEELHINVQTALNTLENQTYIQRNGELYEFLTNEEKDIEQDIKRTELDPDSVSKELHKLIFADIIKGNKIRAEVNNNNYSFTQKLDSSLQGTRENGELTIDIITPANDAHSNIAQLLANSSGRDEMLVVLASNPRLLSEIRASLQTDRYVQQKNRKGAAETTKAILFAKQEQNRARQSRIGQMVYECVANSKIIISGRELEIGTSEPQQRINEAFQHLISTAYTNLKMLKGKNYKDEDISNLANPANFLGENAPETEAQAAVLTFVKSEQNQSLRTTIKSVIDNFERKPNGWPLNAILCQIAANIGRHKLEAMRDANPLELKDIIAGLKNTQAHQNIHLKLTANFTDGQINNLKKLFGEYMDKPSSGNDPKQIATEIIGKIKEDIARIESDIQFIATYPFLAKFNEILPKLRDISKTPIESLILNSHEFENTLLDIKEDYIQPIFSFMAGSNREIFDNAQKFINNNKSDLNVIDADKLGQLTQIMNAPNAYTAGNPQKIKELHQWLEIAISSALIDEKKKAISQIDIRYDQLTTQPSYGNLSDSAKAEFTRDFESEKQKVENSFSVAVVKIATNDFENNFEKQLSKLFSIGNNENGKPAVEIIAARNIKPATNKTLLENANDVDEYLAALKTSFNQQIQSGKKISI